MKFLEAYMASSFPRLGGEIRKSDHETETRKLNFVNHDNTQSYIVEEYGVHRSFYLLVTKSSYLCLCIHDKT